MDKKIFYTIEKNIDISEDGYIVSLACEEDYNSGYKASYTFEQNVWNKIKEIDNEIGMIELMEGYFECHANNIEELIRILNNKGFVYGSIDVEG